MVRLASERFAPPLAPPRFAERGKDTAVPPFLLLGWGKGAGGLGVNHATNREKPTPESVVPPGLAAAIRDDNCASSTAGCVL